MGTDPTRASLRARILLALGALLFVFLAAEVACRVRAHLANQQSMDPAIAEKRRAERGGRVALIDIIQSSANPKIPFELKPNLKDVPFKNAPASTNSRGFRYREVAPDEGPDTVTIVGLGDSIMFGWGLPDGKDYLSFLERMLKEKYPSRSWRVINLAVPAYNSVMEVETLAAKGLQFEPDLVIMSIVPNDLVLPPYLRVVQDVFALDRSYFLAWISERLAASETTRDLHQPGRDPELEISAKVDHADEAYRDLAGWLPFVRALEQLRDLSQEHDFPVVTFSTVEDKTTDGMIKLAIERGCTHVRLLPEIQAYMQQHYQAQFSMEAPEAYLKSDLVISPDDGHPSVIQNWMAAEKLLAQLESSGFIARMLQ